MKIAHMSVAQVVAAEAILAQINTRTQMLMQALR